MESEKARKKVLVVSGGENVFRLLGELLPPEEFDAPMLVGNAAEAKRMLEVSLPDIMIVDAPLPDEFGIQLCRSAVDLNMGIMLLVKEELYERTVAKVEAEGILTLQKPNSRKNLYTAVKLLSALSARLQRMQKKNNSLQEKMTDIRAVNRAKWLLIEKLGMTEKEAHYYIEKRAMDERVPRRELAENIIRSYDN